MKQKRQQLTAQEAAEAKTALRKHESDVGSSQAQVAGLTARILHLTSHMSVHRNDKHSRRGLICLVSARRKHLKYLKRADPSAHGKALAALGLRK